MREEAGLTRLDAIDLTISAEPDVAAALDAMGKQISEAVKAAHIEIGTGGAGADQKEWDIMDMKIWISVRAQGQHIK